MLRFNVKERCTDLMVSGDSGVLVTGLWMLTSKGGSVEKQPRGG